MESLPTEILQKILGYLPVHERVRMERVCKKWKNLSTKEVWRDVQALNIIQPYSGTAFYRLRASPKKLDKIITMRNNILNIDADELEIIQSLLSRAGQHVKKLVFLVRPNYPTKESILSIIAAHCHNIESIKLDRIEDSVHGAFLRLLKVNEQLRSIAWSHADDILEILPLRDWKSLHIGGIHPVDEMEAWSKKAPRVVALIKNSPSLEEFYVEDWRPTMLMALSDCKQLKTFYCEEPSHAAMEYLDTSVLNGLTCLHIIVAPYEVGSIINSLSHCIHLESLKLSYCFNKLPLKLERSVLALPKLESLELNAASVTDEILSRLLRFKRLKIKCSSMSITDNGIIEVIKNSQFLEKLEIPHMSNVTEKFFERLAQNARERLKMLKIEVSAKIFKKALSVCEGSKIHIIETSDIDDWDPAA